MRLADEKPEDRRMLNPDPPYCFAGLFESKQPGSCRVPRFPRALEIQGPDSLPRNSHLAGALITNQFSILIRNRRSEVCPIRNFGISDLRCRIRPISKCLGGVP